MPFRLVGQRVLVRRGTRTLEIYDGEHQLITTHDRAARPGDRQTQLAGDRQTQLAGDRQTQLVHLPPEKVPNLILTRADCLRQAQAIGPAPTALVQDLLAHRPEDRLRSAGRLVRLAHRTSPERLARACARAQAFGVSDDPRIKHILGSGLDDTAVEPAPVEAGTPPRVYTFARQAGEFAASLLGGRR